MIRCGVDLVEIPRIEELIRRERFLARVYGCEELAQLYARGLRAESAAGAFAAKEAFLKVFEQGILSLPLCEIEVLHRPGGAPFYRLSGRAAIVAQGFELAVSITHTDTQAVAFAVAQEVGR